MPGHAQDLFPDTGQRACASLVIAAGRLGRVQRCDGDDLGLQRAPLGVEIGYYFDMFADAAPHLLHGAAMSEPTLKAENEPPTAPDNPPANTFRDPVASVASQDTSNPEPKVQLAEMTTHVIDDIVGTAPFTGQDNGAEQQPPEEPKHTPESPSRPTTTTTQVTAPVVDPRIASLVAIFPTFDHDLLRDVLDECNNNEEHAVDILLGVSDPNHVPSANVTTVSGSTLNYPVAFSTKHLAYSYMPCCADTESKRSRCSAGRTLDARGAGSCSQGIRLARPRAKRPTATIALHP